MTMLWKLMVMNTRSLQGCAELSIFCSQGQWSPKNCLRLVSTINGDFIVEMILMCFVFVEIYLYCNDKRSEHHELTLESGILPF